MQLRATAQSLTGTQVYSKTGTMAEITSWLNSFITIDIAHVKIRPVQ
jgi:hypothetical protein